MSNERVSNGPGYGKYDHVPIQGDGGQLLTYNIFYRSRRELQSCPEEKPELTSAAGTLQMLGCIPRTPSPSPSPVPTNNTNTAREQELRALRVSLDSPRISTTRHADYTVQVRLAELEGTDTKAQGADSKTRIKREIGELEASDDIKITATRSAKKIRNAGPIETIDLTAD